jgi:hypothetical protein
MSVGDVERIVKTRYAAGAQKLSPDLCCPVDYDPRYLEVIPDEVLERDYGCGDPSRHLRSGETVLDLGSGCGKICFIASQVVGPTGRVIGVDGWGSPTSSFAVAAFRISPLISICSTPSWLLIRSPTLRICSPPKRWPRSYGATGR